MYNLKNVLAVLTINEMKISLNVIECTNGEKNILFFESHDLTNKIDFNDLTSLNPNYSIIHQIILNANKFMGIELKNIIVNLSGLELEKISSTSKEIYINDTTVAINDIKIVLKSLNNQLPEKFLLTTMITN
jgi:cell division ATPase FtsA